MHINLQQQPWLSKPWIDILFILLPPFATLAFIAMFPSLFQNNAEIPVYWWVILILLIDVAHVYSTLYRTYFDKALFAKQKNLLLTIPFIGFVAGVLIYAMSDLWFWRILAYVAVFHFVRQQYGFMRVYSRKENVAGWYRSVDVFTIYYATLYPLLYWHLSGPKNFNWFIEGDFFITNAGIALQIFTVIYWLMLAAYVFKELHMFISVKAINIPRIAIITGTILSWYFGIVYFNGDMAFTLLNVVSHGIPYMALVWIYGNRNYTSKKSGTKFLQVLFSQYGIILFIAIIFLFAFVEEGLWDAAVWQERRNIFHLPHIDLNKTMISILVPLLALPQITHYILDGFIWKVKKGEFE